MGFLGCRAINLWLWRTPVASSLIWGKFVVCQASNDPGSSIVIDEGAVVQRDGVIEEVGPYASLRGRYRVDAEIGGPKFGILPGLVNCHHHGRGVSTFQMGTGDDALETWTLAGWGRRDYDPYLMALYSGIRMIESGTTTVMYNHPRTPTSGLESDIKAILKAFDDLGMRVAFSVLFRSQNRLVYGDDEEFLAYVSTDLARVVRKFLTATNLSEADYFSLFESTYLSRDFPFQTASTPIDGATVME